MTRRPIETSGVVGAPVSRGAVAGRGLLGLVVLAACSYPSYYLGVVPEPGRTGVDPSTTVRIDIGAIRDDTPALTEAFELRGPAGPVPLEGRYDGQFLTLTPKEPLSEGRYRLNGSAQHAYRGARGHYSQGSLTGAAPPLARSEFQVGGEPRAIGHVAWSETERVVIFSEPVDLASVEGRVRVDGAEVPVASGSDARMVVFPYRDPLIVDTGFGEDTPIEVRLLAGIATVRGPVIEPGEIESMRDCQLERQLGMGSECY